MSDWLAERLERYHVEMALKDTEHGRLVVGPILATVPNRGAIRVMVGDFELFIQATPKGRRVYLLIDDGSVDVQVSRRHKNGHWS